jgi:YHS domain-containing protein
MIRRHAFVFFAALLLLPMLALAEERVAIKGYDPVAYFTDGKPVAGKSDYEATWQGLRWRFATPAHRDAFATEPEKYAPQYAGYCALGMAMGVKYEIDPEQWTIVDGKLYLNYDRAGRDQFRKDLPTNIAKADSNWSKLER